MNYRSGFVYACLGLSALITGCSATHRPTAAALPQQGAASPPAVQETGTRTGDVPAAVGKVAVDMATASPVPASRARTIPEVPTVLTPLDLSRPPTVNELMAAGQLGGQLYPTHTVSDPEREAKINYSFGVAIQEWNKHEYRQAADLFRTHVKEYPDSPWVAEAKLHLGCDAQYTGRYSEAEAFFTSILSDGKVRDSDGMLLMVNKATLRLGVLKAFQNNFPEAEKLFTTLIETSDNWRDKTYASHWLQRLAGYSAEKLALLNCGTLALAHLLEKSGEQKHALEIRDILPVSLSGQSLQDIREAASRFGYRFTGYRMTSDALRSLPLPAIVQIQGRNPGDSGHYWVLEKADDGRVELFDAQAGRYFSQEVGEFNREWTGNVLVFERDAVKVAQAEKLSDRELSETFGGCCGVPRPPSNLGNPGTKDPKNPCGAPYWAVNPVNMNLYVQDIPLWFAPPIGPSVSISLSYNSQSSIAYSEPFGSKWQFNYGSYLVVDTGGQVTVFMPDGRHDIYSPAGGGGYLRPAGVFNTLVKLAENHFTLTFVDGTVYEYNIPAGTNSLQPFLVKITDANNQSLTFGYDSSVRLVTITDAIGRVTNLTYNVAGRVTMVTDPFGRSASFGYTGTTLTSITDMGGYVSTLTYDANVYLTSIGNSRGTWQFYVEPSTSSSNGSNAFPPPGGGMWANYRITITDPEGNSELHMYNGYSNYGWYVSPNFFAPYVSSSNNSFVNSDVKRTKYNYTTVNGVGRISTVTFPDGTKETFAYDGATGLRSAVTDGHGHTTSYQYNSNGLLTNLTDPKGISTSITYAVNGVDVATIVDSLGTLSFIADPRHNILSRTDRLGKVTSYTYNSYGQVTTATDPLGSVLTYAYYGPADGNNRYRLKQVTRSGKILQAFTYDAVGRIQTYTDASGLVRTYAYDNLDRITSITWPDTRTEIFAYSGCCPRLLDSYTDRAGRTTTFTYDALQRLTELKHPDGTAIRYVYDRNGNPIKVTDPNGNATTYAYDASDRLIAKTFADGRSETYTYDAAGLLVERVGGRGIRTSLTFDPNHNVTNISFSDSTPAVSFVYDNADRVVSRTDGAGTSAYTYDAQSRLVSRDGPWLNDTITYTYDFLGRRTGMQLQGGEAVTYSFDALNRFTGINAGGRQFTYAYPSATASPVPVTLTRPNGSVTTFTADSLNRLTGISTRDSGQQVLASTAFTYDTNDQRGSENTNDPASPALSTSLVTYDYNRLNQLLSTTSPSRTYGYDADGNMTTGYTPDGYQFSASYDGANRLKTITYTDGSGVSHRIDYFYGGNNLVARKVVDGVETRYLWSGYSLLAEINGSNAITRSHVWDPLIPGGIGGLLEFSQGGQRYYPLYDGTRNVKKIINASQGIVGSYVYDPFGVPLSKSGTIDQPYRFSTKMYDEKTGLSYFGFRFYSPVLGSWINRDPLGESDGLNLYRYVRNNPVNWIDPLGLLAIVQADGNNVTITLPMEYTGAGATPEVIAKFNAGMVKYWSGKYGKYNVTVNVTGPCGDKKNVINVPVGNERAWVDGVGGNTGTWQSERPAWTAAHEAGHLMGLDDRYDDVRGAFPGYERNIMGARDMYPGEADIADIIRINR